MSLKNELLYFILFCRNHAKRSIPAVLELPCNGVHLFFNWSTAMCVLHLPLLHLPLNICPFGNCQWLMQHRSEPDLSHCEVALNNNYGEHIRWFIWHFTLKNQAKKVWMLKTTMVKSGQRKKNHQWNLKCFQKKKRKTSWTLTDWHIKS